MGDYADKLTALDTVTALPDAGAEYMKGDESGASDVINRCAIANRTYIENLTDGATGNNLLKNGDMEQWTNGTSAAPDNWTLSGAGASIARSATKYRGTYAAQLSYGGATAILYQGLSDYTYFQGKYVTVAFWAKSLWANARIAINDGVGTSYSDTHAGDGNWALLSVTRLIDGSASQLLAQIEVSSNNAIFDAVKLEEGQIATAFTPWIVTPYATETLRNKTLITPTVADLTNMTHDHADAAGGGTLDPDVLDLAHGMAYRTSTKDFVANNTWYDVELDGGNAELNNVSHDTGTNPERVTVDVAGTFKISYTVYVRDNSVARALVGRIVKNGSTDLVGSSSFARPTGTSENCPPLQANFIATLAASDYLTIQAGTNNASANPDIDVYDDANLPDPTVRIYAIMTIEQIR